MHFVLSLSDILSSYLSFVLCMNFTKFSPLWDQYTDSIVNPLQMCLFGVVPYFDKSDLSEYICHILSVHEVISVANHKPFWR